MITPAQCRAARALLDWSQQQLADAARVGIVTVRQFEGSLAQPRHATLDVIQRALEAAGIAFVKENGGGAGVRFEKPESMMWRVVTFSADTAQTASGTLAQALQVKYAPTQPEGVELYVQRQPDGGKAFYFSPRAVAVMGADLNEWHSVACNIPDLSKMTLVNL